MYIYIYMFIQRTDLREEYHFLGTRLAGSNVQQCSLLGNVGSSTGTRRKWALREPSTHHVVLLSIL